MPFESLSEKHTFLIPGFPEEWIPLVYLYDPDLPLFPIYYFHVLDPSLSIGARPGDRDRAFGFIHHANLVAGGLQVTIAVNKDLTRSDLQPLREAVEDAVKSRLGLDNPVTFADLDGCLKGALTAANGVVRELWYKVVDYAFGKKLPFGSLWDPMFGLPRFIASWNSDGGRKGELIQTHSFLKDFGVRIPTGGGVHADFYLLPTFEEFTDRTNPLASFPRLASLLRAAETFVNTTCESLKVGSLTVSAFRPKKVGVSGQLDTEKLLGIFGNLGSKHEEFLFDHYGAFDRGPGRSVLGLMMLHDLHVGHWNPQTISLADAAPTYKQMAGSYQSPKVMHLYAQLCFGNTVVLPIDNWVETFLPAPFGFHVGNKLDHDTLFASCDVWAKLERLIWLCAQARKVHASVCADTLWCIRFGAPKVDKKMVMRGANPLACKICSTAIRDACPAYEAIEHEQVGFNGTGVSVLFNIETSAGDNTTPGQSIKSCREVGPKVTRYDTYSTRDRPADFGAFPAVGHSGAPPITVEEFLKLY